MDSISLGISVVGNTFPQTRQLKRFETMDIVNSPITIVINSIASDLFRIYPTFVNKILVQKTYTKINNRDNGYFRMANMLMNNQILIEKTIKNQSSRHSTREKQTLAQD